MVLEFTHDGWWTDKLHISKRRTAATSSSRYTHARGQSVYMQRRPAWMWDYVPLAFIRGRVVKAPSLQGESKADLWVDNSEFQLCKIQKKVEF